MFFSKDPTSDIGKYAAKEVELIGMARAASESLAAAEAAAGDAFLDSGETDASTDAVVKARARAAGIRAAITTCRARRLEAVKVKRAGEAASLQKQVEQVRSQLEALNQKTAKCIEVLGELQGMPYSAVPAPTTFGMVPRSAQLENEIQALERRRIALGGELPRDGVADLQEATGMDALIAAVLTHESDTPTAEQVLSWADACEAGQQFGERPRRWYLVWRGGIIDAARSYVLVPSLAPHTVGPTAGTPLIDLGRATFRTPPGWQQPSGSQVQRIRPSEVAAQPEPEPQQAKPPEVAQPQPGASRWVDAPRREKDEGPDWVPAPGAGPGAAGL